MNVEEAIASRYSVRRFLPRPLERATLDAVLVAATQAPSAMNAQPWAFGIVEGVAALQALSDRAKAYLLERLDQYPMLTRYRRILANPEHTVFYDAPALVIIYSRPRGPQPEMDCCLAAMNFMLAAWERGLGTCWIGLAGMLLNDPAVKEEMGVPQDHVAVAPLVIGYPDGETPRVAKEPPVILFHR